MRKEVGLSEARIRAAHKTAGHSMQRVLQELWPWLKDRPFKAGVTAICNDGTEVNVIGYSDNPAALAFFRSLPDAPQGALGHRLLTVDKNGRPKWAKPEYCCLPGGIYDHG